MDDEEEDMSRPISQLWGTPFRDIKYEDRATQMAGQALAVGPTSQSHNSISTSRPSCALHWQPRVPFQGNAGLRPHFPAQFEHMEDRGEIDQEEGEEEAEEEGGRGQEDDRLAEGPAEQAGMSVEVQIGRKLREIGDKFQQDHVEMVLRHHRQNLPAWMRLTVALFDFLFPREALFPQPRGEQR
ncbi:BCL2 modifying factor 2 [Takifugu flavidus]|nr:BCL2 modifying factor 2 [Takifugu flavidus]